MAKRGGTADLRWTGTKGDDVIQPASNDVFGRTSYDASSGYDTLDLGLLGTGVSLSISLAIKGAGSSRLWPQESFSGSWWTFSNDHLAGSLRVENSLKNFEKIIGTDYNDYLDLRGGSVARYVDGGAGDDAIQVFGTSGTTTAVGGLGSDQLFGNLAGEVIVGGTFDGTVATPDLTPDEFVMWAGTILDFELGTDKLYIDATANNLTSTVATTLWTDVMTSYGSGAELQITAERSVILVGVTAAEMNSEEKGFVIVPDGEFTSLAGNDLVVDNNSYHADRMIFPDGSGDDIIVGFDIPLDTLVFESDVQWTEIDYHGDTALVGTYDGGESSVTLIGLTTADVGSLTVEAPPPSPSDLFLG